MADAQILAAGVASAPLSYVIPNAQELTLRAVNADFDGSATASPYVPVVEIISDAGIVIARCPLSSTIAAAGSAEVSWFPGLGGGGVTSGTGVLKELMYAQRTTPLTVTSTNKATPNPFITGTAITLDGFTVVEVRAYCPIIDIGENNLNDFVRVTLWDGVTPIGVLAHVGSNFATTEVAVGQYGAVRLQPAAGSHTYSLFAYHGVAAATSQIFAGTVTFQPDAVLPAYLQVVQFVE